MVSSIFSVVDVELCTGAVAELTGTTKDVVAVVSVYLSEVIVIAR